MLSKIIVAVTFAAICYACANVIVQEKISQYSTFFILMSLYGIMFLFSVIMLGISYLLNPESLITPTATDATMFLGFCALAGVVFFCADTLFFYGYHAGGSLYVVTTLIMTFPAFTAAINYWRSGATPNRYQITSFILIGIAMIVMAKGSQENPAIE